MKKKKTVFVNPYMERLELNGTTSQGKVEPLQNGEREEIWKNLRDIIIQRPPNYILPSYVEVLEERIMDYIMDLLSQSKKEGRLELLTKLNSLYGEYEGNVPEPSISKYDNEYNSGMYTGKLKAMEDVCQKVFDTNGDEIKSLVG